MIGIHQRENMKRLVALSFVLSKKSQKANVQIRPNHWYQWINPWWWRKAKIIQEVLNYKWEHGGKQKVEEAIKNAILYGGDPEEWLKRSSRS